MFYLSHNTSTIVGFSAFQQFTSFSVFVSQRQLLEAPTVSTSKVFRGVYFRKSFLNKGWEYGRLSHATFADFLELSLRVVLMYTLKKGDFGVKQELGICPVEETR